MGLGHDEVLYDERGAARVETAISEHAQRWLYTNWMNWLSADSWAEIKANHPALPKGRV
jgi:hypothetical protein